MNRCLIVLTVLSVLTAACTPAPSPTPTAALPTASASPSAVPTAVPGLPRATPSPEPTALRPGDPLTLTVWVTEALMPGVDQPGGAQLRVQFSVFQREHPNVQLELVYKKPSGKGGLLDFLTSATAAAPALVPDLLVLDAGEIAGAARLGLLTALDDSLPQSVVPDLYPFARESSTVDGVLYAVPFAADIQHLAYNRTVMSAPPEAWHDVLSGTATLTFAAGSIEDMDALIADYQAAGGRLSDSAGQPHLDQAPLAEVLRYYQFGTETRRLVTIAQVDTVGEAWDLYRAGQANATLVNATRYLAARDDLRATGFAAPPGASGPGRGIARAWAWALPVRPDAVRRAAAMDLLTLLTAPENLAAWTLADKRVPTRRAALANWPQDEYTAFLQVYLESARPQPEAGIQARIVPALYQAVQAVLVNGVEPEVAAAAAAAEANP